MRLWNSKAQKVQQGLAFLCLNLPPTTLLPSSDARCSGQGTVGAKMGGERKNQRGGPQALLRENRMGSRLGGHWHLFLFYLVRLGWAGTALQAGAQGLCPLRLVSTAEGMQGRAWQGETYLGSGPGPSSTGCISSLGLMSSVQWLSAQEVPLGGAGAE